MENSYTIFSWRSELESPGMDALGEDVVLFDSLKFLPSFLYPFKSDLFIGIFCITGHMDLSINLNKYRIEAQAVFTIMPDRIIQFKRVSDDFSAKFILLSNSFLSGLLSGPLERVPAYLSVHSKPLSALSEDEFESRLEYFRLIQKEIRKVRNPYRLETVRHLIQAQFYASRYLDDNRSDQQEKTRHEALTEEFLNMVNMHYREQREVGFYAEKLHLTPKYLSKIVKLNSGKSANQWIDDNVILEAKALLKSTNMNIQQISNHLNFPSQSFFGKYFKRKVGVSPKEYRQSDSS